MEIFFFSFSFNTVFYSRIPKETIRMQFRGLTMLKSHKLVIKGGLCYTFAMVLVPRNWLNQHATCSLDKRLDLIKHKIAIISY